MLKNGIIKLGDFGISKALQSNEYAMSFIGTVKSTQSIKIKTSIN